MCQYCVVGWSGGVCAPKSCLVHCCYNCPMICCPWFNLDVNEKHFMMTLWFKKYFLCVELLLFVMSYWNSEGFWGSSKLPFSSHGWMTSRRKFPKWQKTLRRLPASLSKLIIFYVEKLTTPIPSGKAKRVMCFDGMLSLFCHLFRHGQHAFMRQPVTGAASHFYAPSFSVAL